MARYAQTISIEGINPETALALVYQTLKNLEWEVLLAGPDTILGHTPKNWKSKGQQINCSVTYSSLTVISETPSNELSRFSNIHRNNVTAFLEAFEAAKTNTNEQDLTVDLHAINQLRDVTRQTINKQKADYEELDKAMNLTGSNLYATYAIIGINVLVFLLMAVDGAGVFEPNGLVHLRWGSNFAPLTLSGDWWRLITNTFIHFGVIHITMNMYCLYSVATYLEPMLGKQKYLTAYMCTGVIASLVSLWWHTEPTNSAGASGAVFGMYGVFLAFLTTSFIPASIRQSLLKSIGIFILFNLAYGMKSGVDNAAHVGGLLSGFAIGYGYVFSIKKEREQGYKINWLMPLIVLLTLGVTATYLRANKIDDTTRTTLLGELKESSYADYDKFNRKLNEFDEMHKPAMEVIGNTSLAENEKIDKITTIAMPKWEQAAQLIESTKSYDISPAAHNKAAKILRYINLRKKQTDLLKQMAATQKSNDLEIQLNEYKTQADSLFIEITKE